METEHVLPLHGVVKGFSQGVLGLQESIHTVGGETRGFRKGAPLFPRGSAVPDTFGGTSRDAPRRRIPFLVGARA